MNIICDYIDENTCYNFIKQIIKIIIFMIINVILFTIIFIIMLYPFGILWTVIDCNDTIKCLIVSINFKMSTIEPIIISHVKNYFEYVLFQSFINTIIIFILLMIIIIFQSIIAIVILSFLLSITCLYNSINNIICNIMDDI